MEGLSLNSKIDRPRLRFSSVVGNSRITAISFVNNFILLGEGNNLICYSNYQKVNQTNVFKSSVIHGICPSTYKESNLVTSFTIAVYGAKSFAIITATIKLDNIEFDKCLTYALEDWIWDVRWINENTNLPVLAIALAHNSVFLWDCQLGVAIQKTRSLELSLLYSACLIGTTWDNLVVAAGTVFREILLWSPVSLDRGDQSHVLHRLSGHQGVIFSIKFNLAENILCSTSDDRTVRVWKFSELSENELTLEAWKFGSFSLIYTLYGHESRVWQAAILPKRSILVSIGEDSNICLWNYKDGSLIDSKNLSCGGLWSLANSENEILIAMGGGDGSLSLLDLSKKPFTLEETTSSMPSFCPEKDFFRAIALIIKSLDNTSVIATTNSGLVASYNIVTLKWSQLIHDDLLRNYSILAVSEKCLDIQFTAVGTLSGAVLLLSDNLWEPYTLKAHEGKVHSLFWVKNARDKILMSSGPRGCVCLWNVKVNEFTFLVDKLFEITLPKCKQRFPSAVHTLNYNSLCILGDRMGGLHVYNTKAGFTENLPVHSLPSFHGNNGVTDICEMDDLIYTTGRDGQIATFRMSKENCLDLLYSFKVPGSKLEWIGKIIQDNESSSFLLAGFHTMKFVLWSRKKQSNLLELHCGGGHRSWDISLGRKDYSFVFTCLRKNQITTWITKENIEEDSLVTLKTGFHSSKVWCGHLLFVNEESYYVATGGEDNLIIISQYSTVKTDGNMKNCLSLTGHISIVRALDFIRLRAEMNGLMLSAGGQSQFIVWQIWLDPRSGEIGHSRLANHLLGTEKNSPGDHRMRYMDARIKQSSKENNYDIFLACSDSKIRIFQFGLASRKVRYTNCLSAGNSCVFRLDCLINSRLFVSGDGNGILKVWNPNDLNSQEQLSVKLHEAGINSVVNLYLTDNLWLICSGGDDNKIAITTLRKTSHNLEILSSYDASTAHAAQVTGLCLKMLKVNEGLLYSVSIDQRLNVWEWNIKHTSCSTKVIVNLVSSTFSQVADVAGCLVCEENVTCGRNLVDNAVLLYGSGIELFKQIIDS